MNGGSNCEPPFFSCQKLMNCLDQLSDWTGVKAIPETWCSAEGDENSILLDVPSYCQTDSYSCGATAAYAVLKTFKPRADFARFYADVRPLPKDGCGPRRVTAALEKFGVGVACKKNLTWKDICKNIDSGFPMLIGTGKEDPKLQGDHWSVLYGYAVKPDRVFLSNQVSLLNQRIELRRSNFEKAWWNPVGKALVCWGK